MLTGFRGPRWVRQLLTLGFILVHPLAAVADSTATFSLAGTLSVGSGPRGVAVADFNGDGKLDIVTVNEASNTVSILLGNGNGTFTAAAPYAAGTQPYSIAVQDVSGDGRPDVAVTNLGSSTVSILYGNANGTLSAPSPYSAGSFPSAVAIGVLNGDAWPDLVIANSQSATVTVQLGSGNGFYFSPPTTTFAVGTTPVALALKDLNGDGKTDLAVVNGGSNTVSILLGNGSGGFAAAVGYAVGGSPQGVALDDLDEDGIVDVVVESSGSRTVSVLFGHGDGTFAAAVSYPVGGPPFNVGQGGAVAIRDLNGDGKADLVAANASSDSVTVLMGADGPFTAATSYGGSLPRSVAVGDFNGDGKPDFVYANYNGGTVSVYLNTTPPYTSPYADDPLLAMTPIKASHIMDLRTMIDALRARHAMPGGSYTDMPIAGGVTTIRAAHLVELRAALDAVYDVLGLAHPTYVDPVLAAGMIVRRAHVRQLRDAERTAAAWLVLTVTKTGAGSGTVASVGTSAINCGSDCTESYQPGNGALLQASAAQGSTFTGWSNACSPAGAGSQCTVILNADATATANFDIQTATLTVSKSGTGTGTVTSSPPGIDCGADCQELYTYNTQVTLTPTPASDSRFVNWNNSCAGSGACQVTMNSAKSVGAVFNKQYTLTVSKAGTGSGTITSSPSGVNCGVDCVKKFDSGTSVTLTATPTAGSYFFGWTGACSGRGSCVVSMNADVAVGATFNPVQPASVTVALAGTGSGSVTSSPAGISCAGDCQETFNTGTTVTLTASAPAGSYFANWSGACTGGGQCTLFLTGDVALTATFSPFSIDIDPARGTIRMPNKYRTAEWTVGGASNVNYVIVPPGWSVGGAFSTNYVAIPPGWSMGGTNLHNYIAVPPGWSVGGTADSNYVAYPPGWSAHQVFGYNAIVLPPGWSVGGEVSGQNAVALPPGWTASNFNAFGTNFLAVPPYAGWTVGGGGGNNNVGLGPGWSVGGYTFGPNVVALPPGWSAFGNNSYPNVVAVPPDWTTAGSLNTANVVAYPTTAVETLEVAFNDPGWIAWFQALKTNGVMSDSDIADAVIYVLGGSGNSHRWNNNLQLRTWGWQGAAPSGQWP